MKRRIMVMLLAAVLALSAVLTITAEKGDTVKITINGKAVEFSDASGRPFVDEKGRTQVPLRVVMEAYGCDVEWVEESNTAVISKGDTVVEVPIGERHIVVDGKKKGIDTAALVRDGRTYLPIRAVLESFGADVDWENNEVRVSSSAVDAFENIYIDDHGDLIFELANGNEINAGNVEGSNGRSGVSVKDAYVDATGELMIVLSNGRTIDAGNVGVGGSMSDLTFADYPIGTKFYLSHPTGEFEVPVKGENGEEYTVRFDEIYYELIAKRDMTNEQAWGYVNTTSKLETGYYPYEVAVHISGKTSEALSGKKITVSFYEPTSGTTFRFATTIGGLEALKGEANGNFSTTSFKENWYTPKELFFSVITIENSIKEDPEEPEYTQEELIAMVAGDWALSPTEKITVAEDGTITINGTAYTPEEAYELYNETRVRAYVNGKTLSFRMDEGYVTYMGDEYYKDRTWEAVPLTKDNFFTYFEYLEELEIETNAFGDFKRALLNQMYKLKEEYQETLCVEEPIGIKVKRTIYDNCQYVIDQETENLTITWGEEYETYTFVVDYDKYDCWFDLVSHWIYEDAGNDLFFKFEPIEFAGTLYFVNE